MTRDNRLAVYQESTRACGSMVACRHDARKQGAQQSGLQPCLAGSAAVCCFAHSSLTRVDRAEQHNGQAFCTKQLRTQLIRQAQQVGRFKRAGCAHAGSALLDLHCMPSATTDVTAGCQAGWVSTTAPENTTSVDAVRHVCPSCSHLGLTRTRTASGAAQDVGCPTTPWL